MLLLLLTGLDWSAIWTQEQVSSNCPGVFGQEGDKYHWQTAWIIAALCWILFAVWHQSLPLEGTNMHSYLENLVQLEDTAGTSGKSFLEAIRFTSAMPGLRSDEVHLISRRVAGLAEMLMKRAPTIAQAAPLTAEHVRRLERQCCCNAVNSTRNMHRLYTASWFCPLEYI